MDIKKILELFNLKDRKTLSGFIDQKIITDKQILQMAQNTFEIKNENPDSINKIQAQKMLLSLSFVVNSKIQEIDPKGFENYIKILKKNGINAAKEVWAHNFLSKHFQDYNLTIPFLSHGQISHPDGIIKDNDKEFPVEIKVRNPEIINNLNDFFKFIQDSIDGIFPKEKIVVYNIIIQKIINLNKIVIEEEKHDFPAVIKKIKNIEPPNHPHIFSARRKSKNIEWTIEITSINKTPQNSFFMPEKLTHNCLAYTGLTKSYNGKFFGGTHLLLTCSTEVKELLSEKIIKQCFKNAKNLPKEGLIVIFFDMLTNEYINQFFKSIAKKYIRNKQGLAILGLQDQFNLQKKQIIGKLLSVGDNIKHLIQKKSPKLFEKI